MRIAVLALLLILISASHGQQQPAPNQHFDVGEDRLVSTSGPDLPLVEPYLAVNPKDPNNMLAAAMVITKPDMSGWTARRSRASTAGAPGRGTISDCVAQPIRGWRFCLMGRPCSDGAAFSRGRRIYWPDRHSLWRLSNPLVRQSNRNLPVENGDGEGEGKRRPEPKVAGSFPSDLWRLIPIFGVSLKAISTSLS